MKMIQLTLSKILKFIIFTILNSYSGEETQKKIKERGMSQTLDKLVKKDGPQSNLKNLYQNIGTRVSKLKEINEIYQQKMANQNNEIVSDLSLNIIYISSYCLLNHNLS